MRRVQVHETLPKAEGVSRRSVLGGVLVRGVMAAVPGGLLNVAAPAVDRGILRQAIADGDPTDTLDPADRQNNFSMNLGFGQLRNTLVEIEPDNMLAGALAESWEVSDDARQWVFRLRRGVEFHNGKTLVAHDIVSTIRHHQMLGPRSAASALLRTLKDVRSDDQFTVLFEVDTPDADFAEKLAYPAFSICPAIDDETVEVTSGIGTGPYELELFEPGVRAITRRSERYWKRGARRFEGVETLAMASPTARMTALLTGEVSVIDAVPPELVDLVESGGDARIRRVNSRGHVTIPMRVDQPPFDNADARRAIKFAIDREKIVRLVFRGAATVGNDHPIAPNDPLHAPDNVLPQRSYDPEQARFHLKRAGVDRFSVELKYPNFGGLPLRDAALSIQGSAASAGIDIRLRAEPQDDYWSSVWRRHPFYFSYWHGQLTAFDSLAKGYRSKAPWNESGWSDGRFDRLLDEARGMLDDERRRALFAEMQQLLSVDGASVIPIFTQYVLAHAPWVAVPTQIASNLPLDGHRNTERWGGDAS